MRKVQRA